MCLFEAVFVLTLFQTQLECPPSPPQKRPRLHNESTIPEWFWNLAAQRALTSTPRRGPQKSKENCCSFWLFDSHHPMKGKCSVLRCLQLKLAWGKPTEVWRFCCLGCKCETQKLPLSIHRGPPTIPTVKEWWENRQCWGTMHGDCCHQQLHDQLVIPQSEALSLVETRHIKKRRSSLQAFAYQCVTYQWGTRGERALIQHLASVSPSNLRLLRHREQIRSSWNNR